ncbi:MAG: hypothetical protein HQ594_05625 [Candidatus Omnitrophica bacterium]|nr:hypothetical protein [Candidatus Omnitrophota bacterium]
MNFKKILTASIVLAGASAMASQIVFMREFLVVFYGNEISIGIILASWLIWGALGSAVLGRFSDRLKTKVEVFAVCQVLLALALPATLVFIRLSKTFFGTSTGEIVGYYPMILSTFAVFSLPCVIMGFMFSLACRTYRDVAEDPAQSVAHVYIAEAAGSLLGGLIVSYFLIRYMYSLDILLELSFLNIVASLVLQKYTTVNRVRSLFRRLTFGILIAGLVWFAFGGGEGLRKFSLERLWEGFDVLGSKNSAYGNITVTERAPQISFYENGLHLYTVPDRLSAEESVHFALLECKDPERVLLIGGGVGGLLREVLKYPVKEVDYVELDPIMISMAREYLPATDAAVLDDARVRIINEDGRFYVKSAEVRYDCIIISLGDPYTAQLNRFYTVEFFTEAKRIMNSGGVISLAITSSANYIGEELRDYMRSILLSLSRVFPDVMIVPGDTAYFLATDTRGTLTSDVDKLMARMKARGVKADYVREYYLFDKLSQARMEYLEDALSENVDVGLNRDFKPTSYYYATVFWGTHFDSSVFRKISTLVNPENIWILGTLFCFLIVCFFMWGARRKKRAVLLAVMTTGFAEINFQIAVILSFQVIYGYVFYKLGIIITSFMIGLALGGWLIAHLMPRIKDDMKVFTWTQVSICIYPLILPLVFLWLSRTSSPVSSWCGSNIIFPFLPVVSGVIGGIQFPLANKIYLENRSQVGRVAGLSYGLDLFGACVGSFLAAAFLVPILGIFQTCFLVALINVTILAVLLVRK